MLQSYLGTEMENLQIFDIQRATFGKFRCFLVMFLQLLPTVDNLWKPMPTFGIACELWATFGSSLNFCNMLKNCAKSTGI